MPPKGRSGCGVGSAVWCAHVAYHCGMLWGALVVSCCWRSRALCSTTPAGQPQSHPGLGPLGHGAQDAMHGVVGVRPRRLHDGTACSGRGCEKRACVHSALGGVAAGTCSAALRARSTLASCTRCSQGGGLTCAEDSACSLDPLQGMHLESKPMSPHLCCQAARTRARARCCS